MNIKENIMEMNRAYASQMDVEPAESIDDILLTFLVNLQVFDSCRYISEDDEWITFIMIPQDENLGEQIMSLRKSEIHCYGICNEKNLVDYDMKPKGESESLYQ